MPLRIGNTKKMQIWVFIVHNNFCFAEMMNLCWFKPMRKCKTDNNFFGCLLMDRKVIYMFQDVQSALDYPSVDSSLILCVIYVCNYMLFAPSTAVFCFLRFSNSSVIMTFWVQINILKSCWCFFLLLQSTVQKGCVTKTPNSMCIWTTTFIDHKRAILQAKTNYIELH